MLVRLELLATCFVYFAWERRGEERAAKKDRKKDARERKRKQFYKQIFLNTLYLSEQER